MKAFNTLTAGSFKLGFIKYDANLIMIKLLGDILNETPSLFKKSNFVSIIILAITFIEAF